MAGVFSAVVGPVASRLTYRRWTYLVLGATLIVPFTLAAVAIVPPVLHLLLPSDTAEQPLVVAVTMIVAVLAWAAGTSFIPAVRVVEGTAARELLGAGVPVQASMRATNLEARWKTCQWFLVHIVIGTAIGGFTLYVPIALLQSFVAPFTGEWLLIGDANLRVPVGWQSAWIPVAAVVSTIVLVHLVNLAGVGLTRLSQVLLGPTPADHLAELKHRAERLAERNRLARELHDSVGHALSVVTIQASAAGRVLAKDPEFAQRALSAIEEAARDALADLDHVLGLLREDEPGTQPQHTLTDLDDLLGTMRLAGVTVQTEISGDVPGLPFAVSTEAYRIVQECLTNALKHAGKVKVTLAVKASHDALEVEVANPLTGQPQSSRGGRGIAGMRERTTVLRGQIKAGPDNGTWRVKARIPL
ncbi:sensor histidine kinase [Kibdelosporangium aridum]|uniref:sensor histidine kinase n=1 Tax=Kibdelosporangium aridum TaxID=2030 RepID=UPI001F35C839|nr:histidine kinase [Kibdelosporangium aridum]